MRVLLISPLRHLDPPCGDIVYTEALLAHPPEGVEYDSYADAIARGALVEHGNRLALNRAWESGRGRWRETFRTLAAKAVNLLRSWHLLFWEPFRIFSVRTGEYDLVHVHVFNCGFRDVDCPVVVSNALPVRFLYTEARGYSGLHVRALEGMEHLLARFFGVRLTSYWLPGVERVLAFSAYLKDWYVNRRIMPEAQVDVVPIYLSAGTATIPNKHLQRIGFVAKDFEAKGGATLLRAFAIVRQKRPDAELWIVGSPAQISEEEQQEQGIRWLPVVVREELLGSIFPSFDVFAYPTQFDGMPLVLLEAMSLGLAVVATKYRAIPEMLGHGTAGKLVPPRDPEALAYALLELLEPAANTHYRAAAKAHFEAHFAADVVIPQLRAAYQLAMGAVPAQPTEVLLHD